MSLKTTKKKAGPTVYELLVVIVDRGRGQEVLEQLQAMTINVSIVSYGEGAALTDWQNILNYRQEREVVFALVDAYDCQIALNYLDREFLQAPGNGIAFTVPLKSITNLALNTLERSSV